MADEEARVHREAALEAREVFVEAAPVPGHARFERRERDAFDAREHLAQVVARFFTEGRDAEAAVAAEDRRDAVERGGRERRVPERLRVVVGVDVDEARGDHLAGGVDRPARFFAVDGCETAVADADVGDHARGSGAVDDCSAADEAIQHVGSFRVSRALAERFTRCRARRAP
jgi:hypothetical protein